MAASFTDRFDFNSSVTDFAAFLSPKMASVSIILILISGISVFRICIRISTLLLLFSLPRLSIILHLISSLSPFFNFVMRASEASSLSVSPSFITDFNLTRVLGLFRSFIYLCICSCCDFFSS